MLSSIPAPKTADQLQEERKKEERQKELEKQRTKQQAQANDARKAAATARNINNQNWIAAELGKIRQKMAQRNTRAAGSVRRPNLDISFSLLTADIGIHAAFAKHHSVVIPHAASTTRSSARVSPAKAPDQWQ